MKLKPFGKSIAVVAVAGLVLTGCGGNSSDAPAFEDIEASMWESMANSEALSITGVLPDSMSGDAALVEEVFGGSVRDVEMYGSLQEQATAVRMGDNEEPFMVFFEDEAYVSFAMSIQAASAMFAEQAGGEELELLQQMSDDFAGKYIDVSEDYSAASDALGMADILESMRSSADSGQADQMTGFAFDQLQSEGAYMELSADSDETGWFYSVDGEDETSIMNGEAVEYIGVTSDHDSPRLQRMRDGETVVNFSWDDEVDTVEKPTEDQIVSEQDVMAAMMGL